MVLVSSVHTSAGASMGSD